MVRKTKRTQPATLDGPSPAGTRNFSNKGFRTIMKIDHKNKSKSPAFFEQQQWEDDLGPPLWDDDTESLNSLMEEKQEVVRPCYKESCDHDHETLDYSMTETSNSSYTSHSMAQDENDRIKQSRRDRIEQMRADRELVARLELQNMALERETKKKTLNQSINAFLSKPKRKTQAKGELLKSTKDTIPQQEANPATATTEDQVSKVNPARFIMSKLPLPMMDDSSNRNKHIGELPSTNDHARQRGQTQTTRQGKLLVVEAPTLCIKEENFEVGRGRKGRTKTIKRQQGHQTTRSLSPMPSRRPASHATNLKGRTTRSRTPVRTSSRVRRSPVALATEAQW